MIRSCCGSLDHISCSRITTRKKLKIVQQARDRAFRGLSNAPILGFIGAKLQRDSRGRVFFRLSVAVSRSTSAPQQVVRARGLAHQGRFFLANNRPPPSTKKMDRKTCFVSERYRPQHTALGHENAKKTKRLPVISFSFGSFSCP